jgi:hypothetical protein
MVMWPRVLWRSSFSPTTVDRAPFAGVGRRELFWDQKVRIEG